MKQAKRSQEAVVPPLMKAEWVKIKDAFEVVMNDPTVQAHLAAASDARLAYYRARTERSLEGHLQASVSNIEKAVTAAMQNPVVATSIGLAQVRNVFIARVFPERGMPELRLLETPSIDGRAVWTLLNEGDVAALRKELKSGQVWGRLDLVDSTQRPILNAIGSYQRQRVGQHHKDSGRPKGKDPRRQAVIGAMHEGMSHKEVWALAVKEGLRSGPYYGESRIYRNNYEYVRRLWRDRNSAT